MISRATRTLINAASFVALCWIAYVIYLSLTNRGLWRSVDRALSSQFTHANPGAVFAVCALMGFVPIAAVGWVIWRLVCRGRAAEDFPAAKLRR